MSGSIFLFKNNKNKIVQNNQDINQTQTATSNDATKTTNTTTSSSENILIISDLQINLPKDWKIYFTSQNIAKILTETNPYKVYLTVSVSKSENSSELYKDIPNNTSYGWVSTCARGGPMACINTKLNNNYYELIWTIDSDQPIPKDLDGAWLPDHKTQSEDLLNIVKTAKPNPNLPWNTFENRFGYFFEYPKNWSISQIKQTSTEQEIKIYNENHQNVITITDFKRENFEIGDSYFNKIAASILEVNEKDIPKFKDCSDAVYSFNFCASKSMNNSTKKYIIDTGSKTYKIFTVNSQTITPEIEMILSSFRSSY